MDRDCGDLALEMAGNERLRWALGLALVAQIGCYTGADASGAANADDGAQSGTTGAGAVDGSSSEGGDDEDPPVDDACADGAQPPVALRFLTRLEYEHTIRDLFGEDLDVTAAFGADEAVGGYAANSGRAPSSTQIDLFFRTAEALGLLAVTDHLDRFVDCQPEDAGCAEAFVTDFGRRVFRRPLPPDEVDAYVGDFDTIAADQGPHRGLEVVATAMLASPYFLYVGDRSELDDDHARAYDLASRLSYFLWATMPDEALLDAAQSGALSTRSGIESEVRRMLDDPRAADMLASFSTQWIDVTELENAPKHPEQFPMWTPELAEAAKRETGALMQRVVLEDDARLSTLLLSREGWVDAALADLYGVSLPAGETRGWVTLPATERAGLLTRAAFLAGHAHATENSWVHRGKTIRERLLCETLPPPPPVADDSPINDDSRLEDAACASCHSLMDPIGAGFDVYDPIGVFVGGSAPGEVAGLPEPSFDGPLELSALLADDPEVHACFAEEMYRFATRRELEEADACAVEAMTQRFRESEGDIAELVVALATADAFTGGGGGQ